MVIGIFNATFAHIGHMTVRTRSSAFCMNSKGIHFKIGMLGFEHGCFAQGMCPVRKADLIIVCFHIFNSPSLVPWKCKICSSLNFMLVEIILNMALGADQGSHFLLR